MQVTLDQPRMVGKSSGRSALAISSAILTALVVVQAILAGRGWFVNHDFINRSAQPSLALRPSPNRGARAAKVANGSAVR